MAKKKKKRKASSPAQTQQGAYKRFVNGLNETIEDFAKYDGLFEDIDIPFLRRMFDFNHYLPKPLAINQFVSKEEINQINKIFREKYKLKEKFGETGVKISTYQAKFVHIYFTCKKHLVEKDPDAPYDLIEVCKKMEDVGRDQEFVELLLDSINTVAQFCNPRYKYFYLKVRIRSFLKENPVFEIAMEVSGYPAMEKQFRIDKNTRPAYRMGHVQGDAFDWLKISSNLLHSHYQGTKDKLDVYIQSHALHRMKERLDVLSQTAINHTLWKNTVKITEMFSYKNYLYLPIEIYDIKVGYLVADIIDECILFRSFLFVTHNATPEGNKLKEISGLGRQDISYWKIDRLSTFLNLNPESHSELLNLFAEADLKPLEELRDKEFDINTIQQHNLDGLLEYISKGKNSQEVQKNEFDALLAEHEMASETN